MPGKCHTKAKDSSWQTTSRGLPSEKTMAYRNSDVVRAASKITYLGRLYKKNHCQLDNSYQASNNCKQIKTRKNQHKCRHLTVGTTEGIPFPNKLMHSADTTSDSMTSSGGKQSSSFKSNWQARTYKWCTRPAGRQEHTHDSSPRQKLKSLAIQGIAESKWHEPIQSIRRKAVQRHTHTH